MTLTKEILDSLCGDPLRDSIAKPFSFKFDGSWWNAATDGRGLIAERAPGARGDYEREHSPPAEALLRPRNKPTHMARFGLLAKWCDSCAKSTPCEPCDGTGVHSCDCFYCDIVTGDPCPACEGDKVFPIQLPVDFQHIQFDRVLAARFLSPLDMWPEDVPVHIGGELDPIEFRTPNWRILLMPMRRDLGQATTGNVPEGLIRKL